MLAEIHLILLDAEFKLKENVLERETLSDIRTECFQICLLPFNYIHV